MKSQKQQKIAEVIKLLKAEFRFKSLVNDAEESKAATFESRVKINLGIY